MNKELQDKLFAKYDRIFKERSLPMSETCMCWGISTGDGWYHIIDNLCRQLTQIEEEYDVRIVARQVKEKFGTLRFYCDVHYGKRWSMSKYKYVNSFCNLLYKLPRPLFSILRKPINVLNSFAHDRMWKLDGKIKIPYVSMGWKTYGKTMFASPGVDSLINEKVREAEDLSYIVCEQCGVTGATQNESGWISTLCEKCKELKHEQQKE